MAPKRSYKKRSYKKRRTIRKLKTTLRRKIQRGGNPAAVELAFVLFFALFGNTRVVELFIQLLKVLLQLINMIQGGGNGKNFKQRGGDGRLSAALQEFNQAVKTDDSINDNTKKEIDDCVGKLTSSNEPIVMPATNTPDAAAAAAAEAEQAITKNIKEISQEQEGQEQQGPAPENQATNTNFIERMKGKYDTLIDTFRTYFVSKVQGLTSDKKDCINKLLTAGFSIMKRKLLDMTPVEFMKAQAKAAAENVKAALENISDSTRNLLDRASQSETGQKAKAALENISDSTRNLVDRASQSETGQKFMKGIFGFGIGKRS